MARCQSSKEELVPTVTPSRIHRLLLGVVFAATTLLCAGCPKDGDSAQTGGEQQTEAAPAPVGPAAQFIKSLCSATAVKFTVTDEGAAVVYEELKFEEGGTFEAATTIRLGDDPFECTESGTWSLDGGKPESRTSGAVSFEMTETDCAGREAPETFRARILVDGRDIDISHI